MEDELRESLRALAWARYAPLVEHYAAIRAMSDEEYLSTLPPSEQPETQAERLMHRRRWMLDEEQLRSIAREEADRALPTLLECRKATGETGPATELEYHQAVMATSSREIRKTAEMMRTRAAGLDPRRAEILNALAEAADEDVVEFESLSSGPTEDQLQGVTDRVLRRMHSTHHRLFGPNSN